MKSRIIRVVVVLALLASIGIFTAQVFWVQRTYATDEQSFDLRAREALGEVAKGLYGADAEIGQTAPDCFVITTAECPDRKALQPTLVAAFRRLNLLTGFQYAGSSCANPFSGNTAFHAYQEMCDFSGSAHPLAPLPEVRQTRPYFMVYFPHKRRFLVGHLQLWILSSALLLIVICGLCYLLVCIFRERRLDEIQRDFISNMTHEFKTPLSSIQLCAEVLRNPQILTQQTRLLSYATIISSEAAQLTGQVDRILQMAHGEKRGIALQRENFVWQELLYGETAHYDGRAWERGGVVVQDLPQKPVRFRGDMVHLKAAISHLIDNAVKYCNGCPKIFLRLHEGAKSIEISVEDNGPGIDKAHQRLLFGKFFRVPAGNVHDVKGFGLGLNYVRLIARAHGGDVSVSSQLGKGSTFTLSFPRTL